jgi:hypothetical protein
VARLLPSNAQDKPHSDAEIVLPIVCSVAEVREVIVGLDQSQREVFAQRNIQPTARRKSKCIW